MSLDRARKTEEPLRSVDDLVATFQQAERPSGNHQVGLEHEKLLVPEGGATAVPYEGARGVSALLALLAQRGYTPFREGETGPTIALLRGRETISLEPGGQLELSGTPFVTAREAHQENERHVAEVKAAGAQLGLFPVGLGYRPFGRTVDMPWMPKTRYNTMREVLPKRGGYAVDMMLMTATVQVSLDWSDEAECARRMTLAARVSPLVTALYANSPLANGQESGFKSFRSQVWTDVDRARCGYFPAMVNGTFSYRAYVEWALDAPLLFLRRGGQYLTPSMTFRQLLAQGHDGRPALMGDWTDHLSTLFPEVRLKSVMEIRAPDSASLSMTGALPALFRGLLYSTAAWQEASEALPRLTFNEHLAFQDAARRQGLAARVGGRSLGELSRDVLSAARRGLKALGGDDDAALLAPLEERAESGRCPADEVLEAWRARPDPVALLKRFAL